MYKYFFWLIKLGTPLNLYFLIKTLTSPLLLLDIHILIPAQIFFTVSAFRCFFPVNYVSRAVLHNSFFSSIFLTRLFATFSEVAYIYLFSYMIRLFNTDQILVINVMSWLMVLQVCISQCFVWFAILTERLKLYYYEELGWGVIFIINTIASAILYVTLVNQSEWKLLLELNLIFGFIYLPWQYFHLKVQRLRAKNQEKNENMNVDINWSMLKRGICRSIQLKNITTHPNAWGGITGMSWMIGYWVFVIPVWIYFIVLTIL